MADADSGRPIALDDRTTPASADPQVARQQVLDMLRPAVVTDADEPQHDPSARLARLIDLRDVRCCGPGCSSSRCDRDHLDPYPTGPTNAKNLGLACPRCHSAKHHGWTLIRHPDGSVTRHSPLHRRYDRPGPWDPPPHIDPRSEPPPLRARATANAVDDDHTSLSERLSSPAPEPRLPKRGWNDDPPF